MTVNDLGTLIRNGMPTKDIQRQIKDFPDVITTEYFESLGYEHIDAIKYKWKLRQNDRKRKEKEEREQLNSDNSLILSKNADSNNIIIDTCAFQFHKGIKLIEKSKKVCVLYETIKELEKVCLEKRKKRELSIKEEFLLHNIRHYAEEMLLKRHKYKLIPYENDDISYVDDKIIEYLKTLESTQRPTLLTADKFLALKANCLGFEFIFVKEDENNKETLDKKEKVTNQLGVEISYYDESVRIKKCENKVRAFVISGGKCEEIRSAKKVKVTDFDYISIFRKGKTQRKVKIVKVKIEKEKFSVDMKECYLINEIYKLNNIHSKVLNEARNLLI